MAQPKILCSRKQYDARTCHPKHRTIDSTKNHLKVFSTQTITLNEAR